MIRRHRPVRSRGARSRIHSADLLGEAVAGILQRPGRAALTALGTVLGIATFIAVLGLSATARDQISSRFTALTATEVAVNRAAATDRDPAAFPQSSLDAVAALPGVVQVGLTWPVPVRAQVSTQPAVLRDGEGDGLAVRAATPGYLSAIHARMRAGVALDGFHEQRHERVAVLGAAVAGRLGITRLDAQPAIFIGAESFTVIGIIDAVDRAPDTLLSVLLPTSTVTDIWGAGPASGNDTTMLIETTLGAATQVARQAKLAARPDSPDNTRVVPPPDPRDLKDQVTGDLDALLLALAAVVLLVGTVGIANTSLVAVLERVPEIGLRRALGARGRHVAGQFIAEAGALGLLGGLVGTAIGISTVFITALAQQWTPILEPAVVYPAPVLGALTGLVAGLYPAWKATRIEPADALRA